MATGSGTSHWLSHLHRDPGESQSHLLYFAVSLVPTTLVPQMGDHFLVKPSAIGQPTWPISATLIAFAMFGFWCSGSWLY